MPLITPLYEPGDRITAEATAAVIGGRCVMISATMQSPPFALNTSVDGGNVRVAHATAAGRIFGVAEYDAAIGEKTTVLCVGSGMVVPILTGAAIDFFEEVEVGAAGVIVPKATGIAIGYSLADAENAAYAPIHLY